MNAPAPEPKFKKPVLGNDVYFFDETRMQPHAPGPCPPIAAKVTGFGFGGLALTCFPPGAGTLPAEKVKHKSEVEGDAGRKKWWEWPAEYNAAQKAAADAAAAKAEAAKTAKK